MSLGRHPLVRRHAGTLGVLAGLVVLSLLQEPGRITFDTKLDMAVNPIGFLRRALHLWNPLATSGELQNQAYGYLFPMGPFFAAGQLLGVPVWITQRLWCALLLCVGFLGVLVLSRALSLGTEPARYAAGLAYALAPRMLTEIGTLSSEMLPTVLLPWVLLPLVCVRRIGSPVAAAGLSGLAVFAMGGINAAMVVMSLLLPVIWLLTRRWDAAHVRLVVAWCLAVGAATAWWLSPLLLLGRFSTPFLNYIESASNTTAPLSLFQVLRGTNQWVAYVRDAGHPWWPQGWLLVDNPILMAATAGVAALGLAGLARSSLPHRRFLVPAMVAGLTLLTIGYAGRLDSPLAGIARHLLDGPLAPLRNVHKFEPVLRLPLVLGFAHGAGFAWPGRWRRRVDPAVAFALVAVVAAPAWLLMLRPGPGWTDLPAYWRQAAGWLREHQGEGRTLLLPASGFGRYTWGNTVDEPIQALDGVRWALRSQVPLGSPGNTRMMDVVENVLESGRGSPALAAFLGRAGYRYLLVRNDTDPDLTHAPPTAVLHLSLDRSPGITRVTAFGPAAAPDAHRARPSPVDQLLGPVPALEVYEVRAPTPTVSAVELADVPTVSGGPESLLPLLSQGLLAADQPAVLSGDGSGGGGAVATDGLRRAERDFGVVRDGISQTMTAEETPRQRRSATDLAMFAGSGHETVAVYGGIRSVSASTAVSFADAVAATDPSYLPFAALDGDPRTAWHSSSFTGPVGQWLEASLDTPRVLREIGLRFVDDIRVGWPVLEIRIDTRQGSVTAPVPRDGAMHQYQVPSGLTDTVRVTVLRVAGDRADGNVGIRELSLPGLAPERALRLPDDVPPQGGHPPAYSFSRGWTYRPACLTDQGRVRCDWGLSRTGEEPAGLDRLFRTDRPGSYELTATVLPRPGGGSAVGLPGLTVHATSALGGDPAVGAAAALDGDPATAWAADIGDLRPTLTISWTGPRTIRGLHVGAARLPGTAWPLRLTVQTSGGSQSVPVNADGTARLVPVTTDRIEVAVTETASDDERPGNVPAIAELRLDGLPATPSPAPSFRVPCGSGPVVGIDGTRYATAVSGTAAQLAANQPLAVTPCGRAAVRLGTGEHHVVTEPSAHFVVQDLALRPRGMAAPAVRHRSSQVRRWGAVDRAVSVGPGPAALLVVPENANAGWVATLDGVPLRATRVDGWQQAWQLPAGQGGTVTLRFTPDRPYRWGLSIGAVAVFALVLVVLVTGRRIRRADGSPAWTAAAMSDAAQQAGAGDDRPVGALFWPLAAAMCVLAGPVGVIAMIVALLVRGVWADGPAVLVVAGCAVATAVSVAGRVSGHGQSFAGGVVAQAALLLAVAGVVAACVPGIGAGRHTRRLTVD